MDKHGETPFIIFNNIFIMTEYVKIIYCNQLYGIEKNIIMKYTYLITLKTPTDIILQSSKSR